MTRNDRVLLLFAFIVTILLAVVGIYYRAHSPYEMNSVTLLIHDVKTTYALDKDAIIDIGTHHIEIVHNRVRITHAACSDKICEKAGWVSDGVIVCAPFKVVVIVAQETAQQVDAVTH